MFYWYFSGHWPISPYAHCYEDTHFKIETIHAFSNIR